MFEALGRKSQGSLIKKKLALYVHCKYKVNHQNMFKVDIQYILVYTINIEITLKRGDLNEN